MYDISTRLAILLSSSNTVNISSGTCIIAEVGVNFVVRLGDRTLSFPVAPYANVNELVIALRGEQKA